MMPVMTGTRPRTSSTTAAVMRRTSSVESTWPSPVLPVTARPCTRAVSTMKRASARSAASSMLSSGRNGVVIGGNDPEDVLGRSWGPFWDQMTRRSYMPCTSAAWKRAT